MLVIPFIPKQYLEIQLETQEDTLKLKIQLSKALFDVWPLIIS